MTYYDILQVSPNASKEVIEMAYKALAKKHHPDINPPEIREQCEENMKILNHAREVLTDYELRRQYDLELENELIDQKDDDEQESNNNQVCAINPRPWVRYFARMIDLYIGAFLIVFIWSRLAPTSYNKIFGDLNNYLSTAIIYILWLIMESILISNWGTTPGKWIFNSKVININGGTLSFSTSLKRSFSVFLNGMGLLIPLVNLITLIASFNKLKNVSYMGFTTWDIQCNSAVITNKLNPMKIIVFIVILASLYVGLTYYTNVENEAIMQQNAVIQQLNDTKAALDKEGSYITDWQERLNTQYNDITELGSKMQGWSDAGNTDEYNNNLDKYNSMVDNYNLEFEQCENRRLKYNADIDEYNKKYLESVGK